MTARPPHFEVARRDDGYVARIVGANGEVVFASELHPRREDADHACDVVAALTGAFVEVKRVDERTKR